MSSLPQKRKPRGHKPYAPRAPKRPKNGPKTTAQPIPKHKRENLTLFDWQTVVEFYDKNPGMSQEDIVNYSANRREGVLRFTQSALSRHLSKGGREADLSKALANPNALSSKRARIVTRPDVELGLVYFYKHMEDKGETVSGPMLVEKRRVLEELFDVPVEERLTSTGWVQSFCRT